MSDLTQQHEPPSHEPSRAKRFAVLARLTYTTRMTVYFALIAAMTALIAIGVVSFVWEQYFQMYTRDNMQALADSTAEQIALRYVQYGSYNSSSVAPADYAVSVYRGVGVQVVDADGKVVYDSTIIEAVDGDGGSVELPSLAPKHGTGTAGPKDRTALRESLRILPDVKHILSQAGAPILQRLNECMDVHSYVYDLLCRAVCSDGVLPDSRLHGRWPAPY